MPRTLFLSFLLATALSSPAAWAQTGESNGKAMHGMAMNGAPKLPDNFTQFPYANPEAVRGGEVRYCVIGTFDNLNPFILKSMRTTARGVIDTIYGNMVFEPLMRRNLGEPFTLYGLLAESMEMDEDRTYVEFHLNPDAKWSDGKPVTPEDVLFTYKAFTEKGRPPYSARMARVEKLEKTGAHSVRFTFNEKADREFPLVIALTPILPAHAFELDTFDRATLKPVTGSGPYIVEQVEPGQRITFVRNPDYWGNATPSMTGFQNYDRILIDYFLNSNSLFEAFKKGLCSVQIDLDPVKIDRDFNFPAVQNGDVIVETFESQIPAAVSGFFFNTRRSQFADPRVRRALSKLYDFGWVNKNVYGGDYQRTLSFFQGSEISALGRPISEQEKALLAPYMDRLTPDIVDGTYGVEELQGAEVDRDAMRAALALLAEAGYQLDGKVLKNAAGQPLQFEILIVAGEQERIAAAFQRVLARIGVTANLRVLDDAQIQQRKQVFDFDMIVSALGFTGTLSPGIEQLGRWSSDSAKAEGSFNLSGAADPAIDAMMGAMLNARDEETFIAAVRSLDRLLMAGAYLVPTQHSSKQWVAYWNYLAHPETAPLNGYDLSSWWRKP